MEGGEKEKERKGRKGGGEEGERWREEEMRKGGKEGGRKKERNDEGRQRRSRRRRGRGREEEEEEEFPVASVCLGPGHSDLVQGCSSHCISTAHARLHLSP